MATEKWAAFTSRGNVLSTELNSLASAGRSAAGTEVDNGANLDMYGQLELQVTFGTAPSAGGYVEIYMVNALDGTNYEDGSDTVAPGTHKLIDRIPVRAVTTAQRLSGRRFELVPTKTKFLLVNGSGQAFPASGSALALYTTNRTVA
ncbi:MAG: hypothetical protein RBR38_10390 [Desulfomicrobium apsheronum]|jgi:hypothetical protein|nr:hypothetical protein [Desulfomicrobium apsheronum]